MEEPIHAKLPRVAPSLSCEAVGTGEALQGRCLPPVSWYQRDRLESCMDHSAPAQPAPGWAAQHRPRAMVKEEQGNASQEMNRTRLPGRWQWVRLSLLREGMLGSLLAPRFPFLSLLV